MCAARRCRWRNRDGEVPGGNRITGRAASSPENSIMRPPPLLEPGRRDVLRLAGGGVAVLALGTTPFDALAQTAPGGAPLKIATIGAGREGGALGTLFAKAGHPVMFSSRHPEQLNDLVASAGPLATAGTVAEAIAFADVVLLVVPYPAVEQIGKDHGTALAAKPLVMDISNPIAGRDPEDLIKWVEQH